MTAVQWLDKILEGQRDKPFDYLEWKIAFQHALEMEREQRLEMLTNFQVFLNENDYITDTDWDWEHMSIKFLNSKKKDL